MLHATPQGNEEIADWIELSLLCEDTKILRFSEIEKEAENQSIGDIAISLASNVIARRSKALGDNYPFISDGRSIRIERDPLNSGYVFCLVNSLTSNLIPWESNFDFTSGSEQFEEFALSAIKNWLGDGALGVNFGWPSRYGRPAEFNYAIDWLAKKLNVKTGGGFRPPRRKDGGVDLVVWRPFSDNKSGFPIYLIQCTLQQDFISKGRDIDLRLWSGWLALERDPETILAIPRVVQVGPQWDELTANNLVLERIRLVNAFGKQKLDDDQVKFVNKQMLKIKAGLSG